MPVRRGFVQSKWVLGLSGLVVGSLAAPVLGQTLRPVVRSLVKAGIVAERRMSTLIASLREDLEDIAAEARGELAREAAEPEHPEHAGQPCEHGAS